MMMLDEDSSASRGQSYRIRLMVFRAHRTSRFYPHRTHYTSDARFRLLPLIRSSSESYYCKLCEKVTI